MKPQTSRDTCAIAAWESQRNTTTIQDWYVHLKLHLILGLKPGQNPDWDSNPVSQNSNPVKTLIGTWTHVTRTETQPILIGTWTHSLLIKITHLVSGHTEAQVLCVSAQKEFSERQSDRQEVDLLIKDACGRCKWAVEGALPWGLSGLQFYNQSREGRKDHLLWVYFRLTSLAPLSYQAGEYLTLRGQTKLCYCSVSKFCLNLHNPMDCSVPDFPVPHWN